MGVPTRTATFPALISAIKAADVSKVSYEKTMPLAAGSQLKKLPCSTTEPSTNDTYVGYGLGQFVSVEVIWM
jgi:hypothetical protein